METTYEYKKQSNGLDSWVCTVTQDGNIVDKYMVYDDPNKKPIPQVDVIGLLRSLSQEELNAIKQLLK